MGEKGQTPGAPGDASMVGASPPGSPDDAGQKTFEEQIAASAALAAKKAVAAGESNSPGSLLSAPIEKAAAAKAAAEAASQSGATAGIAGAVGSVGAASGTSSGASGEKGQLTRGYTGESEPLQASVAHQSQAQQQMSDALKKQTDTSEQVLGNLK